MKKIFVNRLGQWSPWKLPVDVVSRSFLEAITGAKKNENTVLSVIATEWCRQRDCPQRLHVAVGMRPPWQQPVHVVSKSLLR